MKLTTMTLTEFCEELASNSTAPGGGSVAALEGALGASLAHMVAALTVGKKKYAEHDELTKDVLSKTEVLRDKLIKTADRDTETFSGMDAVFTMPKNTEEQRVIRAEAMQEALKACTLPPLDVMRLALDALELAAKEIGKSNTGASSDLGVAALSLEAAVKGAWLNVLINIGDIRDMAFVEKCRAEGETLLKKSLSLSGYIYDTVLTGLG